MQRQMFITAHQLLDRMLWRQFCDLRDLDLFAVHKGKVKECKKFRLDEREMRILGLCKEVQQNGRDNNQRGCPKIHLQR